MMYIRKKGKTMMVVNRLTCYIKLYRASICDLTAHAASPPHRTPSDPILACNHTMTANKKST